jgi:hypothetical protein
MRGETIIDTIDFLQTPATRELDTSEEKIEALAEMACRAGDEPGTRWSALHFASLREHQPGFLVRSPGCLIVA